MTNNHIRIMDVSDGPLCDWIRESGLTLEECAQIQPSYEFKPLNENAELTRLREHFQQVQNMLLINEESSLARALARKIRADVLNGTLTQKNIPELREELKDTDLNIRLGAAVALSELLHEAFSPKERELLSPLLKGKDENLIATYASELIHLKSEFSPHMYHKIFYQDSIWALLDCLKSKDKNVRDYSLNALASAWAQMRYHLHNGHVSRDLYDFYDAYLMKHY